MMTRAVCWMTILVTAVSAATAQEKPVEAPKPKPIKARVIGVSELAVAAAGQIEPGEGRHLHEFIGRRKGSFYLCVAVSRELPAKTTSDIEALPVELTFKNSAPLKPQAVAVDEKYLDVEKTVYVKQERRRRLKETYYFPVIKGQRSWEIVVNGKTVGQAMDFYTTLVLHGLDGATTRIKMPDGAYAKPHGHRQNTYVLPVGTYDFVLEVRGMGKVKLPWKTYKKGETRYLAYAKDPRNVPVIPAEKLRKGLPKIYLGYRKYRRMKGTGGGSYNIGTYDDPVHVRIEFGRDGTKGPLWRCSADHIQAEFGEVNTKKKRSGSKRPNIVRYNDTQNRNWEVRPWEKAELVYITTDAKEVVGEMKCARLIIRSVDKKPSRWGPDGLLEKGLLWDEKLGYFDARVVKHGEVYVLEGTSTKGP